MKWKLTKERRRGLLFLPIVVFPFCCLVFQVLGGGKGAAGGAVPRGLNMQLPPVAVDWRKAFQDKLKTYELADKDSVRKGQYQRQDPYHVDSVAPAVPVVKPAPFPDPRAEQLERRLAGLRSSLQQPVLQLHPANAARGVDGLPLAAASRDGVGVPPVTRDAAAGAPTPDPQLDRLNAMLDKVIRIQHPQEAASGAVAVAPAVVRPADAVLPADSGVNSIAAVVPEDQTLVAGGTIALRITDAIRVAGCVAPAGEMVYGTVSLNADRLLVHIGALRRDRNLYPTDWQVVDLDGLPGIHIPGLLGREVAKQSADQGVNALNVLTLDPSLGAQAAGAGIQAAKSFLGRKVREVRVTVRAGYQVLLRNLRVADGWRMARLGTGETGDSVGAMRLVSAAETPASADKETGPVPPDWPADGSVLERCRNEGMELRLRSVRIRDSLLWFGLEWANHSPIGYSPAYMRWTMRDRRVFRRTAVQEQGLEPWVPASVTAVGGDSVGHSFVGFRPFALAKDKQLVLEVGEKGGGRTLVLIISSKTILKAKPDEPKARR
ncbi:MAG TPA: conjugative transposon protein TraM [Puia sp.]|uniref:conjugative transposon protein TraM n=1 Tax=Puia sp. TaxID=2045100 RepID=UPI002C714DAB|nr:conjugative transposon protein TraM [Puia sp.]HVU95494.1 conjugative transposon protein TraM [Puia sp.]